MGSAQSIEKSQEQIAKNFQEISRIRDVILKEGNGMVRYITNMKYNSPELCRKLEYQYVDMLKSYFPIHTLKFVADDLGARDRRVQLGMKPDQDLNPIANKKLTESKDEVCKRIVSIFQKKIVLIEEITTFTDKCTKELKQNYDSLRSQLSNDLSDAETNQEEWGKVYVRFSKMERDIKSRYVKLNNLSRRILMAKTMNDVDKLSAQFDKLKNTSCSITVLKTGNAQEMVAMDGNANNDLFDFT